MKNVCTAIIALVIIALTIFLSPVNAGEIEIGSDGSIRITTANTVTYEKTGVMIPSELEGYKMKVLKAFKNPGVIIPIETRVVQKRIQFLWLVKTTKIVRGVVYNNADAMVVLVGAEQIPDMKTVSPDWFLLLAVLSILFVLLGMTVSGGNKTQSLIFIGAVITLFASLIYLTILMLPLYGSTYLLATFLVFMPLSAALFYTLADFSIKTAFENETLAIITWMRKFIIPSMVMAVAVYFFLIF